MFHDSILIIFVNYLNDLKIIEKISGLTYEQFSQKLMLLLNKLNNPLIKNQNIWI